MDDGSKRGSKGPSTNGTYINSNKNRLKSDEVVFIEDGDLIQVGDTNLKFKSTESSSTIIQAVKEVVKEDPENTILLTGL